MKRGYLFEIRNKELVCLRYINDESVRFTGKDAIALLQNKDKIKFKKVRVQGSSLILDSKNTRLYITEEVLQHQNNYTSYLTNNLTRISKAIEKHNKGVDKVPIKKGKYAGVAVAGVLAAVALAATACQSNDNEVVNEVQFDEFEDLDNLDEDLFESPIINSVAIGSLATNESWLPSELNTSYYEGLENMKETIEDNQQNNTDISSNFESINPEELIEELENTEELDNNSHVVNVSYNDYYDEEKFNHAYNNYINIINERAPRWGADIKLMTSILCQESGGYNENLMQIQFNSWKDMPITSYNYEKECYETIILTEHPENYPNRRNTQLITPNDLLNPKTNISVACIIIIYCFERMDHNIIATIQAYNFGVGNMETVLEKAAEALGTTPEEILADQNNLIFLDYRVEIKVGDPNYVENVLRFLQNPEEGISIRYIDENGEKQQETILIQNINSQKSL